MTAVTTHSAAGPGQASGDGSGAAGQHAVPGAWPMYRAMVGVGLLCGLLIVSVYQVTLEPIKRNKAAALQRAISVVLPGAESSDAFVFVEGERFEPAGPEAGADAEIVYVGRDNDNAIIGFAIPASGMGYADVIQVLYGYSIDRSAVVGLQVLESKETPGLGDKIEKDMDFVGQFEGAAAPLVGVKARQGTGSDNEIDMITGVTISSRAIIRIINNSLERLGPLMEAYAGGGSQ